MQKVILFVLENGRRSFMHKQSFQLHRTLIGWFALGLTRELKCGQNKCIYFIDKPYVLARSNQGILFLNGDNQGVIEQHGIIFFWHHPKRQAPSWTLPLLNQREWSPFLHHELLAQTHPQEVYENSIDVTHFSMVHDFHGLEVVEQPFFENHMMSVKHRIRRKTISIFRAGLTDAEFEVRLYGIGCAYNHIHVPSMGLNVRMLALTTPTKQGQVCIRLAVAIQIKDTFKKIVIPLLHRKIAKNIVKDFSQDLPIWENKCYRERPLLVRGDGQILKFREWCKQFYGE